MCALPIWVMQGQTEACRVCVLVSRRVSRGDAANSQHRLQKITFQTNTAYRFVSFTSSRHTLTASIQRIAFTRHYNDDSQQQADQSQAWLVLVQGAAHAVAPRKRKHRRNLERFNSDKQIKMQTTAPSTHPWSSTQTRSKS